MSGTATDRILGVQSGLAMKAPCACVSTGNLTLSGLQTVGGITQTTGMRTLVKAQTNGVENGIYNADTGAWTRALDFDGSNDVVQGTIIPVYGSATAKLWWVTSSNPVIPDTSSITISTML